MNQKNEIKNLAIEQFAFLKKEYGLSKPIIRSKDWGMDIYYLASQIGFQIELDWHDFNVFILIALLEDGKIPGGYYMHKNKRCRVHLATVLKELRIQDETMNFLMNKNKRKNRDSHLEEEVIKQKITLYSAIVQSHAEKLINIDVAIFEGSDVLNS